MADAAERERRMIEVLQAVGLDPDLVLGRFAHEFSGGQCQRLCIARALILEPELIVCDEPVSALDVSIRAQILNLLEAMKARYGLTLLFIAHDLAVVKAVSDRVARGNQFMLPVEDAIEVSELLAGRYGLPKWQYTSSATQANVEAIRVARVATGRQKVVMFEGKYHGHFDEALVELDETGAVVVEERGVPDDTVEGTILVPFNDPAALTRAQDAAVSADVFLSIGTSNLVEPAASLPWVAARHGARVVVINTTAEGQRHGPRIHHILGQAGEVLPALVASVWGEAGPAAG